MAFNLQESGSSPGTNVLKGTVDATLAANLPAEPFTGDRYSVSVAGNFQNDALVLPNGYAFTVGDVIEWDGSNWLARESGDDSLKTTSNLSDLANATTARTNLDVYSTGQVDARQGYVWSKVNGATNAVVRNGYLLDSSGGIFTVTLPATPAVGDTVAFTDLGSASTNNITIGRNGSNIDGDASDLIVNTDKAFFKLTYADATIGWALSDVGQVA